MARQVTTVAGATSVRIHCEFTDQDGKPLLERDIKGKVGFLGGNLRATYDLISPRRPPAWRMKTSPLRGHDRFVRRATSVTYNGLTS